MRLSLVLTAVLLAAATSDAQCPNGQCPTVNVQVSWPQSAPATVRYVQMPRYVAAPVIYREVPVVAAPMYYTAAPVYYAAPVMVAPRRSYPTPIRDFFLGR